MLARQLVRPTDFDRFTSCVGEVDLVLVKSAVVSPGEVGSQVAEVEALARQVRGDVEGDADEVGKERESLDRKLTPEEAEVQKALDDARSIAWKGDT